MESHQEGWFVCEDHCGKKFKNQKFLQAHLLRVNEQQEMNEDRCYAFSDFKNSIASADSDPRLFSPINQIEDEQVPDNTRKLTDDFKLPQVEPFGAVTEKKPEDEQTIVLGESV